jgi:hypothetical protein
MCRTIFTFAVLLALAAAACVGADTTTSPETTPPTQVGWTRLPDPPLSARTIPTIVWTGTEVIVAGGWEFECGPGADCAVPEDITFADGAGYDPITETWRSIADAPAPFSGSAGVAVGGAVYVLTTTCWHPDCDQSIGLMRYRPDTDAWDAYPPPPVPGFFQIAATDDAVITYSQSDENGEVADWRFEPSTEMWAELPNDPLPRSFDRQFVTDGDDLLLFASPLDWDGAGARQVNAARYNAANDDWEWLPPSGVSGYGAWIADGHVVINPHFRNANGGIYDIERNAWERLPPTPPVEDWDNDLAGVLGAATAVFAAPRGWVLDLPSERWIEIAPLDDRVDFWTSTGITSIGRNLFLFGGERWNNEGVGSLLGDAWIWQPPS